MSGLAAKYLVLNNAGSLIPTMAVSQLRTHFLGRVADPIEVIVSIIYSLPLTPSYNLYPTGISILLCLTGGNSS